MSNEHGHRPTHRPRPATVADHRRHPRLLRAPIGGPGPRHGKSRLAGADRRNSRLSQLSGVPSSVEDGELDEQPRPPRDEQRNPVTLPL